MNRDQASASDDQLRTAMATAKPRADRHPVLPAVKPTADRQEVLIVGRSAPFCATCPRPREITADRQELLTTMATVADLTLPGYLSRNTAAQAGFRLACLAWLVEAPSMRGVTQTELGRKLGVTKAAVSKTVLALSRATGYRRPGQKPRAASPRYSAGAQQGWARRRENDERVQRALDALAGYQPAVTWLKLMPKHRKRQILVLIGALPTAATIRTAAARGANLGWRGLSQVRRHVAAVIKRHNDAAREGLLRQAAKESLQVVEREEPATGTKSTRIYRDSIN